MPYILTTSDGRRIRIDDLTEAAACGGSIQEVTEEQCNGAKNGEDVPRFRSGASIVGKLHRPRNELHRPGL